MLVSMLIPVYNVEAFLPRCLDSILSQTYQDLEVVLIDDGSTDGSAAICDTYAARDCRVRVIHKENGGISSARNAGLDAAVGELLMFVDSDDYLSNDAVQRLYDRLVADESDMAVGKFVFVYPDGRQEKAYCRWMAGEILTPEEAFSYTDFPVCIWGKLYRREIFANLRCPNAASAEDLWIFPDVMERCSRISIVDHVICYYYQRWNSLSYTYSERTLVPTVGAKIKMTEFLLERGYISQAKHFYHTAIGTAALFEDRCRGKEVLLASISRKKRRRLTGMTAHVRWLGIRCPGLYGWLYKVALKVMEVVLR